MLEITQGIAGIRRDVAWRAGEFDVKIEIGIVLRGMLCNEREL